MVNKLFFMSPTIRVSKDLLKELKKRKHSNKDTYEGVIWDLLEDGAELSDECKLAIKQAEADVKAGRVVSFESVKKKMGARRCMRLS